MCVCAVAGVGVTLVVCLGFKHMARVSWTVKKLSSDKPLWMYTYLFIYFHLTSELCLERKLL